MKSRRQTLGNGGRTVGISLHFRQLHEVPLRRLRSNQGVRGLCVSPAGGFKNARRCAVCGCSLGARKFRVFPCIQTLLMDSPSRLGSPSPGTFLSSLLTCGQFGYKSLAVKACVFQSMSVFLSLCLLCLLKCYAVFINVFHSWILSLDPV